MYHLLPFLLLLTSVTGDGNFRFTSTHVIVNETPFTQASFGISRTGGQAQPVTLTCQVSTGCQIYYRAQLFERRLLNSSPRDEFGCWCLQSCWRRVMLQLEGEVSMQSCERPPPGTITLNNSVEYLPTSTYLALTSRGKEGREKLKQKMARKQQAIATTLCKELQASNCVCKSRGVPARGIELPPRSNVLIVIFVFLLLGFHLQVREKWAKMYKSVSQHNYLSIFLNILSFVR